MTCQSLITPSHLFSILSSCSSGNILYHRTLQQCAIDSASDGETVTHYLPKPGAHEHSEGKYVLDVGSVGSYCKSSSPDRRPKAWSGTALLTLLPTSTRTPYASCHAPNPSTSRNCPRDTHIHTLPPTTHSQLSCLSQFRSPPSQSGTSQWSHPLKHPLLSPAPASSPQHHRASLLQLPAYPHHA